MIPGQNGEWELTPTEGACVLSIDRSKDTKPKLVQIFELKVSVHFWCLPMAVGRVLISMNSSANYKFDVVLSSSSIQNYEVKFEVELYEDMEYVAEQPNLHKVNIKVI